MSDTYAQAVRDAARHIAERDGDAVALFESSAPEPVELLRKVIAKSFGLPITPKYRSVFSEDNSYILESLSARYDLEADRILCTTGATGAIDLLYRAYLKRGDRVLVETPGFDIFADFATVREVHVDRFHRRPPDFQIDLEEVANKLTPETRFIVISNLHNPSSAFISDETLTDLASLAEARGVTVIVDEVYRDFVGDQQRMNIGAKLRPNVITVSSLTKIYGLSTLRCGWIVASPEIIDELRGVTSKFEFNISKLAHAVAAEVLAVHDDFDDYVHRILADTRPIMASALAEMQKAGLLEGALPEHGCICFPRAVGVEDSRHLAKWLVDKQGVYVVPGEYFGAPGYIRLGYAIPPKDLKTGLANLATGLAEYSPTVEVKSSVG